MKIKVSISKNGIATLALENNKSYLYGKITDYYNVLDVILNGYKNVSINNNTIDYNDGERQVIIENYLYNSNPFLERIISRAKQLNSRLKIEEYRKKQVTRRTIFLSATVISLGAFISSMTINDKTKEIMDLEGIQDTGITLLENDDYTEEKDNVLVVDSIQPINEDKKYIDNIDTNNYNETYDYGSRVNSEKYKNTRANYYDIIEPIAKEYGLDPNLILAIATQESGDHNVDRNGPAMGLMQIELSVWDNKDIYAYNHNTKSIEKLHITKEQLKDVRFNIKAACMIFQSYLKQSNYNLEVAIQMYNYGPGNVKKAIRTYYDNPKLSLEEFLNDYDSGWLSARSSIKAGDKNYLEHVLSYVEDLDDVMCFDSKNNEIKYNGYNKHLL